jgi:hypothetical protein
VTSSPSPRRWSAPLALVAYAALVLVAAWPLSGAVRSVLPGSAGNDTGVYVWNLWVFRYELLVNHSNPLWTSRILYPGPPIDLALHNYTIFQDAVALALVPLVGLVGAFNLTWLLMQALSGFGVFLLARRQTSRDAIAWLAGAMFACSPTMIARSTAHQSLVAAGPLAFFLWFVLRAADRRTVSDAVLAGVCAAWAATCDAYFGIYCALLLTVVGLVRLTRWEPEERRRAGALATVITAMMLVPLVIIVIIALTGGRRIDLLGTTIWMRTLYTPVLVLSVLAVIRIGLALRARGRWRFDGPVDRFRLVQLAVGVFICALLLSPLINTARLRVQSGGSLQERVLWRSSPAGVDLLAFLIPNPNHPLAPQAWRDFLTTRPDMYPENVASIPYVALVVIAIALYRLPAPRPRTLIAIVACFGLLALGPFLVVGHLNTHVPGPWALMRYLPIVGAARTPTRFAIPMLMGISVLFAWGLDRLTMRRRTVVIVALAMAFELLPVPRLTATAAVPAVYSRIASDPDDVSVLELPFGIWDGTSQLGFANTATMYYQATHQKRLIGGYLSRIPRRRLRELMQFPTLRLLTTLSGPDGQVDQNLAGAANEDATYFVQQSKLRYVVIDTNLASPQLRDAAIRLLSLHLIQTDGAFELYRVP